MAKKKTNKTDKQNAEDAQVELSPEEQAKKSELVTFVANNILNTVTLNQTVTILQQVALRDANTIVDGADEAKMKELTDALEASKKSNQPETPAVEQSDAAPVPA